MVVCSRPTQLILMGVSGSGKSTIGSELANRLRVNFIDADDLHPESNISKMRSGQSLDDQDREPWLIKVREQAIESLKHESVVVVACSALKRKYRELLRGELGLDGDNKSREKAESLRTCFIYLQASVDLLRKRMDDRKDHFMKPAMLSSQLETLEEPDSSLEDNRDGNLVITVALLTNDRPPQPKSMGLVIQSVLEDLESQARISPSLFDHSIHLPPIHRVLGLSANAGQLEEILSLLFEPSESIKLQLIPNLLASENSPKSYEELLELAKAIVRGVLLVDSQAIFLGSHPRIGEVKGLSKLSSKEQNNQAATDPRVLRRLEELNGHYEKLYPGLRYVTFVNGRSRADIVTEMEAFLCDDNQGEWELCTTIHDRDQAWYDELRRGIEHVFKIAESRLKELRRTSGA